MEWISVKDRLPDKNVTVWATDGRTIDLAFLQTNKKLWCRSDCIISDCLNEKKVTHWMPIPKLSKE